MFNFSTEFDTYMRNVSFDVCVKLPWIAVVAVFTFIFRR